MSNPQPVNILLVEDDEVDVEIVRRGLTKLRIANHLHRAHDGIEALEMLRAGAIGEPVRILLDINMPRMNGIEFLDALRNDPALSHHVVFMLTTSGDQADVYEAYRHHVSGYLRKRALDEEFTEALELVDHYWRIIELPSRSETPSG